MRICTAKASGINREAAKSGCAREWGGWGRISDDGPGQQNPDRSEGPWGRAAESARTEVLRSASSLTQCGETRWQQRARRAMANQVAGKAASELPALKPYRGKPAVRNFRGGNGNVGIIRSPVRAIALPDLATTDFRFLSLSTVRQIALDRFHRIIRLLIPPGVHSSLFDETQRISP